MTIELCVLGYSIFMISEGVTVLLSVTYPNIHGVILLARCDNGIRVYVVVCYSLMVISTMYTSPIVLNTTPVYACICYTQVTCTYITLKFFS